MEVKEALIMGTFAALFALEKDGFLAKPRTKLRSFAVNAAIKAGVTLEFTGQPNSLLEPGEMFNSHMLLASNLEVRYSLIRTGRLYGTVTFGSTTVIFDSLTLSEARKLYAARQLEHDSIRLVLPVQAVSMPFAEAGKPLCT